MGNCSQQQIYNSNFFKYIFYISLSKRDNLSKQTISDLKFKIKLTIYIKKKPINTRWLVYH